MVAQVALPQSFVGDNLFAASRLCTIPAHGLITPIAELAVFAAPLLHHVYYSLTRRRGSFSGLTDRGSDGGSRLTNRGILVTVGQLRPTLSTAAATTAAAAAGAVAAATAASATAVSVVFTLPISFTGVGHL